MEIEQTFDGEIYEIEVPLEDKDRLRHVAHYPIKDGPRTFKSVNVFDIIASDSGKKVISFWKSRLTDSRLEVEEETNFQCQPDELQRLIALLDNLEEVAGLERGNHVILAKDAPSVEAAKAAIESIESTETEESEELAVELIKSVSEIEPDIDNIEGFADELPDDVVNVEYLISRARARNAIDEFRELIEAEESEQEYQEFLENHPWIFGARYVDNRDERELTRDEEVDFCLETVNGYYDIFEIKRPNHTVMVEDSSHDTYRPSAKLSEAVSQVQHYIKEIEASHSEILRRDGLDVLKPRGTVVIGADLDPDEREGLRVYNSFLTRIDVVTYSELARKGDRLIQAYQTKLD